MVELQAKGGGIGDNTGVPFQFMPPFVDVTTMEQRAKVPVDSFRVVGQIEIVFGDHNNSLLSNWEVSKFQGLALVLRRSIFDVDISWERIGIRGRKIPFFFFSVGVVFNRRSK